jgi:hypothetical protein
MCQVQSNSHCVTPSSKSFELCALSVGDMQFCVVICARRESSMEIQAKITPVSQSVGHFRQQKASSVSECFEVIRETSAAVNLHVIST